MSELNETFWSSRYTEGNTGWDLGDVSPPIKAYFDKIENKELVILIPGCGNAHEAEYLHKKGFKNVHIIDLSAEPLHAFRNRVADFPMEHIHQENFFLHEGTYDVIIEQTMFCAIDPSLRGKYAQHAHQLLKEGGELVGLLFNKEFDGGPPFGGTKDEYDQYFRPLFSDVKMDACYNSIPPRQGSELFIQIKK